MTMRCIHRYYAGSVQAEEVDPNGDILVGWVEAKYSNHSASRAYTDRYLYALYWSIMTMTTVQYVAFNHDPLH